MMSLAGTYEWAETRLSALRVKGLLAVHNWTSRQLDLPTPEEQVRRIFLEQIAKMPTEMQRELFPEIVPIPELGSREMRPDRESYRLPR